MLNRRRRRFVHPRIQIALVLQSLRQWMLFLFAMIGLLCGLEYFNNGAPRVDGCLRGQDVGAVWAGSGGPLIPVAGDCLRLDKMSNRFVGPLMRLRTAMQGVARGADGGAVKVSPQRLRRGLLRRVQRNARTREATRGREAECSGCRTRQATRWSRANTRPSEPLSGISLMFDRLRRGRRHRDGVAATELAVCLPPLLLLVVASIEFANMIFLNHSLSIAAYESARHAVAKTGREHGRRELL